MRYRILFYREWYCFSSTVVWWIHKPTIWAAMENSSLEVLWLLHKDFISVTNFVLNLLTYFAVCVLPSSGVLVSVSYVYHPQVWMRRSRWPRGLRPLCAAAIFGLRVRIPLESWMFVSCECCVVEVSATHRSLVQSSPTECACVVGCDQVKQRCRRGQPKKKTWKYCCCAFLSNVVSTYICNPP
jgi:hypothetical protein